MLPFQLEPPPPLGMSPAEAALRQRQRMLQAGVFVCCLLLLLDTRGWQQQQEQQQQQQRQAAAGLTLTGEVGGEASMVASQVRSRLDAAIGSTKRRRWPGLERGREKEASSSESSSSEGPFANVTGLYQGQWRLAKRNSSRRAGLSSGGGAAVLSVETLPAQGFREVSVARALVSLTGESPDRADDVLVSAFGLYFHGLGRLVMIANVGSPSDDAVELRWRRARQENATANRTRRQVPEQQSSFRRALRRREPPSRARARVAMGEVVRGFALELVVEGTETDKKASASQNFTLDAVSPLAKTLRAEPEESAARGGNASAASDDDAPAAGVATLRATDRRPGYPQREYGDVWRNARCAFLVDLEEVPSERQKLTEAQKAANAGGAEELALKLVGHLSGCGLAIEVTARATRVDWDAARRAALGYSLLMTTVCVVQIALLFRQLHFSRTQAVAARVSLVCVAAQALIDAVVCVANLLLCAAVQTLFAAFAAVAFFELVIFCVVEMRYVVVVFQAHDPQRFWLGAATRRQLAILHAQFYLALFAALCAVYFSRDDVRLVAVVAYSFWLPQIVRNARHEYARPFHDSYLYGMALSRLVAPFYVYAYPYSLVAAIVPNAKLRPLFCLALLAWQAAQVAVLKAQATFGPRFFIPTCFLPARYDYRRPLPALRRPPVRPPPSSSSQPADSRLPTSLSSSSLSSRAHALPAAANANASAANAPPRPDDRPDDSAHERGYECVICFQDVLPSGRNHLITPCDHVFHDSCLLQWMQFKLECPVCRSTLPPMS